MVTNGLANTFKVAYLYQLNVQYTNGVRLNVEDLEAK
jgi:hypothetical protein